MKHVAHSLFLISILLGFGRTVSAGDDIVWRPVTPEEIQQKAPRVEPGADAEALFWEVCLDDKKLEKVIYEHYVRVKIFTERGREKYSKFDIPFAKGKKIENLAARVIRSDGSIVVLNPSDIFEREILTAGKIKVKAMSFALPSIEPGVIVEYQYKETYKGVWGNGLRLPFQRDVPVQNLTYKIRPQQGYGLNFKYFNMPDPRFVADPSEKGFYTATVLNVPAYKVEPFMPPEDEVRPWIYLTYASSLIDPWPFLSRRYSPWLSRYASPTDIIRKKSAELTANAPTDDAKLRSIYDFVQKKIRNISFEGTLTDEERDDLDHDHAEDTLKKGLGNSVYVELLFAALAKAAGFEVNLVFAGDRSSTFFHPDKYPSPSFVSLSGVAINVNSEWKFFHASVPYLPYGYLPWNKEGVNSMLVAEKGFRWEMTPRSGQAKSLAKRSAKLQISEDGTLDGTVRLEYYGHQAISRRAENYRLSQAQREENLRDQLKTRISTAEVSEIGIENFDDTSKPLVFSYKVRIPHYAQKTGKRLFVQPGFFEYGVKPVFSASTRTHNIYFSYAWSEQDSVDIQFPKDFETDNPDQPAPIADPGKIGSLKVQMGYDKATRVLKYRRDFYFGDGISSLFGVKTYAGLKNIFDAFQKADSHIVTFKQAGAETNASTANSNP